MIKVGLIVLSLFATISAYGESPEIQRLKKDREDNLVSLITALKERQKAGVSEEVRDEIFRMEKKLLKFRLRNSEKTDQKITIQTEIVNLCEIYQHLIKEQVEFGLRLNTELLRSIDLTLKEKIILAALKENKESP